ncbi:MAG: OsmC family peroxiredoxin [Candidatus Dormibacteria bacterium]|jgi:osmotically inducible protein OsmC
MPITHSTADATWSGDLAGGAGSVRPGSGSFPALPLSWGHRAQREQGSTSPEELIAAAHAGCYSMGLANELARAGHPPARLETGARVAFETGRPDGAAIVAIELTVRGVVPGIGGDAFQAAAEAARVGCPVSKALSGVEIRLQATLEG